MKKIIILVAFVITLTGCSYRELNDLAIGNAIGIDYNKEENAYKITVQVLNLQKDGNDKGKEDTVIYEAEGETISGAIRNISLAYPKVLYLGHLELVILGESVLNHDVEELFEYFIRSPETRNEFDILINTSGTAKEILDPPVSKNDSFPSKEIIKTLENSMKRQGTSVKVNMEEFIGLYLEKRITPVITTVELIDDKYTLNGIVAFDYNNDKIIHLSKEATIAYNLINENFYDVDLTTNYNGSKMDFILLDPKASIKTTIKDNKLTVDINVKLSSQPAEIRQKINLEDEKVQSTIQKDLSNTLTSYIKELLTTCKENNIDVLGIKNIIYKNNNSSYERFEYLNLYEVAKFNINVNTQIFRYGNIYRSTKGE